MQTSWACSLLGVAAGHNSGGGFGAASQQNDNGGFTFKPAQTSPAGVQLVLLQCTAYGGGL
jgi:hypothetical protein